MKCSGSTNADCTEHKAGSILTYGDNNAKGTCGPQCTEATGNNGCETCGLVVDGTRYCSKCKVSTEYPQNGVCAPKIQRTAACNDVTIQNGVCTTCANGYFKMNGGCYETTKFPGKSVCTAATGSGGSCTATAPGYYLSSGTLAVCPEGCETSTASHSHLRA